MQSWDALPKTHPGASIVVGTVAGPTCTRRRCAECADDGAAGCIQDGAQQRAGGDELREIKSGIRAPDPDHGYAYL